MGKYGGRRAVLVKWHIAVLYFVIISARSAAPNKCNEHYRESTGIITSPEYPQSYKSDARCTKQYYGNPRCIQKPFCVSYCYWNITTDAYKNIRLSFSDLHIPLEDWCCPSYLEVWDGRGERVAGFCGEDIPDPVSVYDNHLILKFASTNTTTGVSFNASWTTACASKLLTGDRGNITSPRYPDPFKEDGECKWTIEAKPGHVIDLTFTTLALGSNNTAPPCTTDGIYAFVSVYDGEVPLETNKRKSFCHRSSNEMISSLGNYLTVVFTSKGSQQVDWNTFVTYGFNATYVSRVKGDSELITMDTFAFGPFSNDTQLGKDSPHSEYFFLGNLGNPGDAGMIIGTTFVRYARVFRDGKISFREDNSTGDASLDMETYVCAYCSNIDNSYAWDSSGDRRIYYHMYTNCDKTNARNLCPGARTNALIQKFTGDNFTTHLLLVATWSNVKYKESWVSGAATFQAVIASNGVSTYALLYYKQGQMNWKSESEFDYPGVDIGIRILDNNVGKYKKNSYAFSKEALQLDDFVGNTDLQGLWIYRLDLPTDKETKAQSKCMNWYTANSGQKEERQRGFDRLPDCPCWTWRIEAYQAWVISPYTLREDTICYQLSKSAGRDFLPYGKLCCYNAGGWSIFQSDAPYAGSATAYNPSFSSLRADYLREDEEAYQACCQDSSSSTWCNMFYQLRPRSKCRADLPIRFSWLCCDPHFMTLDEKDYVFNGWGEYTMTTVTTSRLTFTLQGRAEPLELESRQLSNATVFTAFGAEENGIKIFFALDTGNKSGLVVYADGTDYTRQARSADFLVDTEDFTLSRKNETLIVSFPSGISIAASVRIKSLAVSLSVPLTFQNQTRGLLGNFNGNKDDDFILPNGTVLRSDLTEREMFEDFGTKWAVTDSNTVMRYGPREGPASYAHPEFIPIFLDEQAAEARQAAERVCGTSSLACIYDYVATGSAHFALDSKQFEEEAVKENEIAKNTVPQLDEPAILHVTSGSGTTFTLQGHDQDVNDVISYHAVGGDNSMVQVNSATGVVTYTPDASQPTLLSFYALDSHSMPSPVRVVPVVICSGCSGHGTCDFSRSSFANKGHYNFQYAACVCEPAWAGPNCEMDRDGCAGNPCGERRTCNDLTTEQQGQNQAGYTCGSCHDGFTLDDSSQACVDNDECADNPQKKCHMQCANTLGSYRCLCDTGYRLDSDGRTCWDIDECQEKTDKCDHICNNTEGGYQCLCEEGYTPGSYDNTCIQDSTTASICSNAGCSQGCKGVLDPSTGNRIPECFCFSGYDLDPSDNQTCLDHNECQDNICPQKCFNFVGGFACYCNSGYRLSEDKTSCEPCPSLRYGPNCELTCTCSGRFQACHPVRGCVCEEGWTGSLCQDEIDECSENSTICNSDQICTNTRGSYACSCLDGYEKDADGSCQDIDECAESSQLNTCGPLERCVNQPGSFYCTCKPGYRNFDGICTDVDECAGGNHDCEQVCVNVPGTYNCDCYYGYSLNPDRVSCTKVSDVCVEVKGMKCAHGCTLSNDSDQAVCFCRAGYQLSINRQTCLDINECAEMTPGCSHTCTNSDGGFHCSCPVGMKLDKDGKTCLNCPDGTYGLECDWTCNCGVGSDHCDVRTGCVCKAGWQPRGDMCDDINECETKTVQQECQSKNARCVNYQGGYRCQCEDGYRPHVNGLCLDINECLEDLCDQQCENLPGSYRCSCDKGFRLDSQTGLCKDINECKLSVLNKCTQRCINMIGSYKCACDQTGYVLDSNGVSCSATVTCQRTDCPVENGGCSKEQCFCNSGYDLTGNTCQRKDVDWCEADWCEHNCLETEDGNYFKCSCRPGYFLQKDNLTCNACPQGRYGHECSNICVCNKTNAISCNTVDGTCRCKAGWEGTTCSDDTDECAATRGVVCPDNSYCLNSAGGYSCPCKEGYLKRSSGSCVASCTGGGDCGENAASCDSVTGACKCKAGWEGPRCEREINECMTGQHDCRGDHSICVSRNGGYECLCEEGYNMVGSRGCVGLLKVRIKFTFNDISVTSTEISDRNSQSYSFWANSTSKVIASRLLPSVKGFRFVTILMLRVGSLIVEADIVVDATSHPDSTQTLSIALLDMAGDSVTVSGQKSTVSVFISDDEVTSSWTACQVYEAIQPCPGNEECHMEKELPECRTVERGTPDIILAIVLGITIPLIIITIIIVTVVCIVKKKNKAVPRIDLYTKDFNTKSASSSDVFTVQTSQPVSNSNTPLQTAFDPGQSGTRPNTAVENPYAKPTSLTAQPTGHNYAKLSPMFGGSATGLGNTRLFTQPLYKDDLTYNTINDHDGPGSARPPSTRSYASVGGCMIGLDENSQEDGANYTTGQGRRDSSRQEQ